MYPLDDKGTVMAEAKVHAHSLPVQDSVYEHRILSLTSPALLPKYYQWDHLRVCTTLLMHLLKPAHRSSVSSLCSLGSLLF